MVLHSWVGCNECRYWRATKTIAERTNSRLVWSWHWREYTGMDFYYRP